ncbi:MAG: protein kinase, partial [Myxococcota bacterium]
MTPERFRQLRAAFEALADLDPAEQAARLSELAQSDGDLAASVERLLLRDPGPGASSAVAGVWRSAVEELAANVLAGPGIRPGSQLDRYEAVRRLGRGSTADVWEVRDVQLGSRHALKVLRRVSASLRRRLLNEGTAQASLHHPNLVPVRTVLEVDGLPALLMPLVTGPSLGRQLKRGRLRPRDALALFFGIVEGVAFAHARGFVHRDLKPDNVLLDPRFGVAIPRVTDFGLVKEVAIELPEDRGAMVGTPRYAAPEQFLDSSQVDARADVFSLGVLLVELMTGAHPFPQTSVLDLVRGRAGAPNLHGLAGPLAALASQLMAPSAIERPSDGDEVAERLLRAVVRPSPMAARRVTPSGSRPSVESGAEVRLRGLPAETDRFVGRTAELAKLEAALSGAMAGRDRIVTVTGPGGAGKTRLVKEALRALNPEWTSAWWVDLSEARERADLVRSVLSAFELAPSGPGPLLERLQSVLAGHGRCLVCFDNVEQLDDGALSVVRELAEASEEAVFLLTSRWPLRIAGERVVPLEPLTAEEACSLFVLRAGAMPEEPLRDELVELVELLDRLPLLVELAAARADLGMQGLLGGLTERFQLLASASSTLPARQRTLRRTLDWSWALLTEVERQILAWCCIFEGGFTLEAAQHVLEPMAPGLVVDDVLVRLIEHGWLRRAAHEPQQRFTLLVSMEAYASEKLQAEPELQRLHQQHARYYGDLVWRRWTEGSPPATRTMRATEFENLRAIVDRRQIHEDVEATARAAIGILARPGPALAWDKRLALAETGRALPVEDAQLRAWLCHVHGATLGDGERTDDALAAYDQGLVESRRAADPHVEATLLKAKAILLDRLFRRDEAETVLAEAYRLDPSCNVEYWLGQFAYVRGRPDEAWRRWESVRARAREERDPVQIALAIYALSYRERERGSHEASLEGRRSSRVGPPSPIDDRDLGPRLVARQH